MGAEAAQGTTLMRGDEHALASTDPARAVAGSELRRETLAVGGLFLLLYLATSSAVPALSHDSMGYLVDIESGDRLFHPNHLAYNAVGAAWLWLARAAGIDADSLRVVAALDAVLGAAAMAAAYNLLRSRAQVSRAFGVLGVAGAGLSYGAWFFSVSVEVYMLPLLLTFVWLHLLTAERIAARTFTVVGLLHGLIILGHQSYALLAAVVVYVLVRRREQLDVRAAFLRYASACTAVVVAAYGAVLALEVHPDSPDDAVEWSQGLGRDRAFSMPDASTLPKAVFGFGRAVFGGHFTFSIDDVRSTIERRFPEASLDDELFMARGTASWVVVCLLVVAAIATVALVSVAVTSRRERSELSAPARRVAGPLAVWCIVFALYFCLWEPDNPEFWIAQVTILWLLLALAADAVTTRRRFAGVALAVAVAGVAVVTGVGSVAPARDADNDLYRAKYGPLDDVVTKGDVVVVDEAIGMAYTLHMTDARPLSSVRFDWLEDTTEASDGSGDVVGTVRATLASGHDVVIDRDLLESPSTPEAALTAYALRAEFPGDWPLLRPGPQASWYLLTPSADSP